MDKNKVKAFADAYIKCKGNKTQMAKELGIARMSVYRNLNGYMKKYPKLFVGTPPLENIKNVIIQIIDELSKLNLVPKNKILELREKANKIY